MLRWLSADSYGVVMAEEKLRLGGMALANGVLVHGPTSWAAAVRTEGGEIEVASGPKRLFPSNGPLVRGPARLLEALLVLPRVRRNLPQARFAFQRPAVLASLACCGSRRPRHPLHPSAAGAAGAGSRRAGADTRAARAARARPGRLPRSRARLHRHLRARHAGREGARTVRHASRRAPAAGHRRRRDARRQGARVGPPAGQPGRRARRDGRRDGDLRLDGAEPRAPGRQGAFAAGPGAPGTRRHRRAVAGAGGGRRRGAPRLPRAREQLS